jgi:hypothetical protein
VKAQHEFIVRAVTVYIGAAQYGEVRNASFDLHSLVGRILRNYLQVFANVFRRERRFQKISDAVGEKIPLDVLDVDVLPIGV